METARKNLIGSVLAMAVLCLALLAITPSIALAGDLADVELQQSFEPVDGVRLIQIRGMSDGEEQEVWVTIHQRDYEKLRACFLRTGRGEAGPAVQFDDKTRRVTFVLCDE